MKKFKEVAHLYLPFSAKGGDGDHYEILGQEAEWDMLWQSDDNNGVVNVNELKPILHRISDMPLENQKELFKLVFNREFPETRNIRWFPTKDTISDPRWVLHTGVERLGIEITGRIWADSDLLIYKFNQHLITAYLLEHKYDLFGLIDSGEAIDSKTLKQ